MPTRSALTRPRLASLTARRMGARESEAWRSVGGGACEAAHRPRARLSSRCHSSPGSRSRCQVRRRRACSGRGPPVGTAGRRSAAGSGRWVVLGGRRSEGGRSAYGGGRGNEPVGQRINRRVCGARGAYRGQQGGGGGSNKQGGTEREPNFCLPPTTTASRCGCAASRAAILCCCSLCIASSAALCSEVSRSQSSRRRRLVQ